MNRGPKPRVRSKPDRESIIKQYSSGLSVREIAHVYGIGHSTLRRHMIKLKIQLRANIQNREFATPKIANKLRGRTRPPRNKEWNERISAGRLARPG